MLLHIPCMTFMMLNLSLAISDQIDCNVIPQSSNNQSVMTTDGVIHVSNEKLVNPDMCFKFIESSDTMQATCIKMAEPMMVNPNSQNSVQRVLTIPLVWTVVNGQV